MGALPSVGAAIATCRPASTVAAAARSAKCRLSSAVAAKAAMAIVETVAKEKPAPLDADGKEWRTRLMERLIFMIASGPAARSG
jgi:hypothetical protein